MNTIIQNDDITIFYVTATTFPNGIMAAHERLHSLVPFSKNRRYISVSRPEKNGVVVYRAGAEALFPGEGDAYDCESLVLKKGNYVSMDVDHFKEDPQAIKRTFDTLMEHPGLDPQGYCVEWYRDDQKTVTCMIRLER